MIKKTVILIILALLFFAKDTANAQTPSVGSSINSTPSAEKTNKEKQAVTRIKDRSDKEIGRRIDSLNKLISRINEMKKISKEQKAILTAQIQTQITDLTTLKTKVDADTDLQNAKTDAQSIIKSYRIYALFIPKIHILATSDRMLDAIDKTSTIAAKLNTRISEAKGKGQDVSSLESLYSDMQSKITDAKTQAQNAIDLVTPLVPEGYPGNKTSLMDARKILMAGRQDLQSARIDARKIVNELKSVLNQKKTDLPSSTSSAVGSTSSSSASQ